MHHIPVFLRETLTLLMTSEIRSVYDGTLGLGGHAEAILEAFPTVERYLGTDLDSEHLAKATARLSVFGDRFSGHHAGFDILPELINDDVPSPRCYFFDLGICSHHVDNASKGFSFQADGPLDMRFDQTSGISASEWIVGHTEQDLTRILRNYGDLPRALYIARAIKKAEPSTTEELAEIVRSVTHFPDQKKALALTFQALRIEVNRELERLDSVLASLEGLLQKGDRVGIMSFHSLEDRRVKRAFKRWAKPVTEPTNFDLHAVVEDPLGKEITKKPLAPTDEELALNSRSRSAKFRIFECTRDTTL